MARATSSKTTNKASSTGKTSRGKTTSKATSKTKAVAKKEVQEVNSTVGLSSLLDRAGKAKKVEEQNKDGSSSINWLKLLHLGANETLEGTDTYIKGAKGGDYVLAGGTLLGKEVEATIIGAIKVYKEVKPSNGNDMEQVVGFWRAEDAEQIPLEGWFERPLANGNVLKPCHWLFLYLHDEPEVQPVVLSFQSIGNKYYKNIMKAVNAKNYDYLAQCRILLTHEKVKNEKYNKTFCYVKAEIFDDENFSVENGAVIPNLCETEEEAVKLLQLYTELHEGLANGSIVNKHDVKGLIPYSGGSNSDSEDLDVEYEEINGEDDISF